MKAPGQSKIIVSNLHDENFEELVSLYLFPSGKLGYKVKREVTISPVRYFNQGFLNFRQNFAADIFAKPVVEQGHLKLSINIAM